MISARRATVLIILAAFAFATAAAWVAWQVAS